MYFRAPGRPDVRHLRLIGVSTNVAGIAITRHRRVEALRASEERLRLALSGGNVDIWEYDMDTAILQWHGGLKTILGSPSGVENVNFQSLVDAIHPEDRKTVQSAFHDSLAQGSRHDVEFRVIDPEGSLHWFVSKGLREYDSTGKAVRMRGVAFEVTKWKRAEEEIQKREAALVEAQRIARLGSYEWDVRTNTVHRSEELCRIFGLLSDEFESTLEGYLARVHPDDRSTTRRLIDQASRDGQPFDFEERIVRPDGSIRILHSQGQFTLDDNQQAAKLVGVCHDITERKQVEQQLRAANAGSGSPTS
jgi:PAS domain S-box-containing protein